MKTKSIASTNPWAYRVIGAVSLLIPLVVIALMYLPERYQLLGDVTGHLPLFHAVLNGVTAVLLLAAWIKIKQGKTTAHRNLVMSALLLSVVFLVSYVISKIGNEPTPYGGEGLMRPLYFFILITHIILAALIVPMALLSAYWGLSEQLGKHRKLSRFTMPIWVYVAITGVLVYLFMYPYY